MLLDEPWFPQVPLLTNLRLSRPLARHAQVTVDVYNVMDRRENDIEFFYESHLPGEAMPVADRHVHPVSGRTVRVAVELRF